VIAFALDEASRRHTTLRVAQYWSDIHADFPMSGELLADRQRQLDTKLADLHNQNPAVGVIGELLLDDSPHALSAQRGTSQLLVVSAASRHLAALLRPL